MSESIKDKSRTCSWCRTTKAEEFPKTGYYCRACAREYRRIHYGNPANKQTKNAQQKQYHRDRYKTLEGRAKHIFSMARPRAIEKGIPFTITEEWMIETLREADERFKTAGLPFDYSPMPTKGQFNPMAPSIDQDKPGKGYTPENARIVPWWFNALKGNYYSTDQAVEMCSKFVGVVKP